MREGNVPARLHITRYAVILAGLWTLIVGAAYAWSAIQVKSSADEAAYVQAEAVLDKDVQYRHWNSDLGGVYVPASDLTPPNPYLAGIPERDVVTPSGRMLTLVNPAYMTRQVNEMVPTEHGEISRITSLNPLRPENLPDEWEAGALRSFEQGAAEQITTVEVGGQTHYRLMRPLVTEESCLKCHASQGYQVGDIRGGICVNIPVENLYTAAAASIKKQGISYSLIWLLGIGGIFAGATRLRHSDIARTGVEMLMQKRNQELAALYEVSGVISQELDLRELLAHSLEAVTNLAIFGLQNKGGIFLIEGKKMNLVVSQGQSEGFIEAHQHLLVGECCCGFAAETGEVLVSTNSLTDVRHEIEYPGMEAHGHIIIPFKSSDRVLGVLFLYTPADVDIGKSEVETLRTIGNQLGAAIERVRLFDAAKSLSLHDALTGLANRNLMNMKLAEHFAVARRYNRPFSLILIDLDRFKVFNDTRGHLAGDRLLKSFSRIVSREVRESDLAVRFGGEEFLVILTDAGAARALEVAERIRRITAATDFGEGKSRVSITVSAGVAAYDSTVSNVDELISRADAALYQAKEQGRNRIESWPA